jgi:pilus assembly protein FimV
MQRSPHRFLASSAGALVLAAAFSCTALPSMALAAELGDVVVRSHIGQQLSADIELVMLTPEDQAGVQVKLAGQNIYLGANVRMHPALSSLRMSVVKRDNRQFLHLTTLQPLDAELVHLFLELGTGSRASVRSATLWLTPEPPPLRTAAPAPAPGSAPAAALAGPSAAAPRSPAAPSSVADTGVGPAAAPSAAERAAQEAQAAANRAAAIRAARMRAAANAARDAGADTVSTAPAAAEVKPGPAAVPIKLGPEPRVARSKTGAAKAAACAPGQPDGEAQQCVALDQTNAELKTKLVNLEDKVKQLQAALAQGGTTAAAPAAGAGAAAAGPAAAPAPAPGASATAAASAAASAPEAANQAGTVIPPATPPAKANGKKKREAGGVNTTTMVVGGVLLLALLGGLLAYLVRRKKIKFSTEPLKVWQGWRKNKSAAAPEAAAEAEAIPEKE